jgi:hypothetical protein
VRRWKFGRGSGPTLIGPGRCRIAGRAVFEPLWFGVLPFEVRRFEVAVVGALVVRTHVRTVRHLARLRLCVNQVSAIVRRVCPMMRPVLGGAASRVIRVDGQQRHLDPVAASGLCAIER